MAEEVNGLQVFHVTRQIQYNKHAPLDVGTEIDIGANHNPFFGFYEGARTYRVNDGDKVVDCKAIAFLANIMSGKIIQPPALPTIAHSIAEHYVMLARELIMEEVRKEIAPDAPSRQKCLWATDTAEQAQYWEQCLGGQARIATLELDGVVHRADASLLLGDSEPLSVTYDRARQYWVGEMSENPQPEVLFTGAATVVAIEG